MAKVRNDDAMHQRKMHRFAIQLYGTLVERYGIHDEQARLALRLVEATNPSGLAVVVPMQRPYFGKRSRSGAGLVA